MVNVIIVDVNKAANVLFKLESDLNPTLTNSSPNAQDKAVIIPIKNACQLNSPFFVPHINVATPTMIKAMEQIDQTLITSLRKKKLLKLKRVVLLLRIERLFQSVHQTRMPLNNIALWLLEK